MYNLLYLQMNVSLPQEKGNMARHMSHSIKMHERAYQHSSRLGDSARSSPIIRKVLTGILPDETDLEPAQACMYNSEI